MNLDYLALARLGKNRWWRYLLSVIVILFCWQILGSIPVVIAFVLRRANDPFWFFVVANLSFWGFLFGILFAVRVVHGRPIRTLITPHPSIGWSRLAEGFAVWFALSAAATVLDYVLHPATYQLTFEPARWLLFAAVIVPLTPVQTTTEELFFRGYLLQSFGLLTRRPLLLATLSGIVFAVPHFLNPEMAHGFALMALYYFCFGAFLAYVTLRDGRLELALGIHAANNLFAALAVNYKDSVLTTPAVFTQTTLDVPFSLVTFLLTAVVSLLIFFRPRPAPESEPTAQQA